MSHQLKLFELEAEADTPDALSLLRNGAMLVLSVSGGKDSGAMTHHLYPNPVH